MKIEAIEQLLRDVPYISNDEGKRHRGAAIAKNELLVFLDSDCLWTDTWMPELHRALRDRPDFQALNGMILYERPGNSWAFALHLMEFHEFLGRREWRPRFLHSGNLVIRKQCFKESGGYREDIPMYEDFTFGNGFTKQTRKQFHYLPRLSIVHTEHLIGFEEIKNKTQTMGYWRAKLEASQDAALAKHLLPLPSCLKPFLGSFFFPVILFRMILRFTPDIIHLRLISKIFWLALVWNKGYRKGFTA